MGMTLKISKDRKTANAATPNGKQAAIANAFGLSAGVSCPGRTSFCDSCYAERLEKIFGGFRDNMQSNFDQLQNMSYGQMASALADMMVAFVKNCDKRNAPKRFRIHHDGDLFSQEYAHAWATVIRMFPDVQFWAYTRSFEFVDQLEDLPNLVLYLSVDNDNLTAAIETKANYPWVKIAGCADTFDNAKAIVAQFGEKSVRCPELNGALPLISTGGGACNTCGLCIEGRNNVLFASKKK